jgi:predicted secreted protein
MALVQAAVIYVLIWTWVLLFVQLWGLAHQMENSGPVPKTRLAMLTIPSATVWRTTIIASLLFGLYYALNVYSPISFRDFVGFLGKLITPAAIYFVLWWVVLFAVLPWGVRSQQESGQIVPGSDPGAPAIPRLATKLLWTTTVTTVIFGLLYVVYVYRLLTLDDLAAIFRMPR